MKKLRQIFRGVIAVGLTIVAVSRAAEAQTVPAEELLLSVDGVVQLAMERSLDLRAAAHGLSEAKKRVSEEWGTILPDVSASASYVRNISPAVSFVPARVFDPTAAEGEFISLQFGADNSWQSAISVQQKLFDARAFIALSAAEQFEQLQVEVVRGRAHDVATRVRVLCYDLLLHSEELRLTERSLDRVRQALTETQAQHEAGMSTSYDVLRLQVELANLEPSLLRSTNAITSTRRQLAVELDLESPHRLRLADDEALIDTVALADLVVSPATAEDLVLRSRQNRSDLRQLEQTALLRKTDVRSEQTDYLPTVSLFGSWDVQAQQNGSPNFFGDERSRATSKIAGVSMSLPLFSGMQRGARVNQKRAVQRQAETELQVARGRAAAEVRDLAEALAEAAARERGQRLAVTQAGLGYQITLARYRRGIGSRLEMTDAEVALRRSEFNHAQAAHDLLTTRARLDLALGQVAHVDGPTSESAR